MGSCTITPIHSAKACSGKCKTSLCRSAPRVWVAAACEGMVSLFEKHPDGSLAPRSETGHLFSNLGAFTRAIESGKDTQAYDQLVLVGSNSDIAWLHASLPGPAAHQVAAEIPYPLMAGWFREPSLAHLKTALQNAFA